MRVSLVLVDPLHASCMPAEAPATTSASVSSVQECPKCGTTKKSGKRSCCARGGAWFKKCGDVGDSNFEHTWGEGMEACKSFEPLQALLSREETVTHSLNVSSTAMQNSPHPDGVSDAVHTDAAAVDLSVAQIFTFFVSMFFSISRR